MRARIATIALLLAGCSPALNPCKSGTVFATVTLAGDAQNADHLSIVVTSSAGGSKTTPLEHTPGAAVGGVQIEFPNGYPKGESITVTITALLGSAVVATQTKTIDLKGGCVATSFQLGGTNVDGATTDAATDAAADGSLVDLTEPPPDGSDLAVTEDLLPADDLLPPVDLTPIVYDLINCVPQTENCFNGIDDDCDNKIDCDDDNCVVGATPIAHCVPDPGANPVGLFSITAGCSSVVPIETHLYSDFSPGHCNVNTCTCPSSTVTGTCFTAFFTNDVTDTTCLGGSSQTILGTQGCRMITPIPNGNYHVTVGTGTWTVPAPPSPTGTPSKSTAEFAENSRFCSSTAKGGGCPVGQACVPAPAECLVLNGNQVACPSGYVKDTTNYYAGMNDNLTCACGVNVTDGTCALDGLKLYTNTDCTGEPALRPINTCTNNDYSSYIRAQMDPPTSQGSCVGAAVPSGTSVPVGDKTVCCVP